jgi:two-component system, chemotaxis family, protein-glutamate methylesterase/glutaminase
MVIRVLLVDDSDTARKLMKYILGSSTDIEVVGEAHDGEQAIDLARKLKPDIIVMDINMPRMDGLEATRAIMTDSPTPIIVVSASVDLRQTEVAFQALRLGALTVLPKPVGPQTPEHREQVANLISSVRAMSGVRVIRHHWNIEKKRAAPPPNVPPGRVPQIVGVVSSTGGPAALNEILGHLPADFPLPIVIVQHIAPDFLPSMVDWLNGVTPLPMGLAEPGTSPQPGHIYVAPGDAHLLINRDGVFVQDTKRPGRHIPSGDVLLESIAQAYAGQAIGVILTGMGGDGAEGLRQMHLSGAYTIAQDQATSVVYGMPHEAVRLEAVSKVLPLPQIAPALIRLARPEELR